MYGVFCGRQIVGLLLILLLSGCAQYGPKPITDAQRAELGRLGLATVHYAPEIDYDLTGSKVESAAKGAATGALTSIGAGAYSSDPYGLILGILLAPVFATGGAVYGAVAGDSASSVQHQVEPADNYLLSMELQQLLALELLDHTAQRTAQPITRIGIKGPSTAGSVKPYQEETGLDTVLEIGLESIRLVDSSLSNDHVVFEVSAYAVLVNVGDGRRLLRREYRYASPPQTLESWTQRGALHLKRQLKTAVGQIAGWMTDDLFLPVLALQKSSEALIFTKPQPKTCFFCEQGTEALSTRKPRLCWQVFPHPDDLDHPDGMWQAEVREVRYDVWVHERAGHGDLIEYGIEQTCHQVQEPLEKCTVYNWSARARFRLGQSIYATPWVNQPQQYFRTRCK